MTSSSSSDRHIFGPHGLVSVDVSTHPRGFSRRFLLHSPPNSQETVVTVRSFHGDSGHHVSLRLFKDATSHDLVGSVTSADQEANKSFRIPIPTTSPHTALLVFEGKALTIFANLILFNIKNLSHW
jgi:hypothetical protein